MKKEEESSSLPSYEMVSTNRSTESFVECSDPINGEARTPLLFDTTTHDLDTEDDRESKKDAKDSTKASSSASEAPRYDPPPTATDAEVSQPLQVSQEAPRPTADAIAPIPPHTATSTNPATASFSTNPATATLPAPVTAPPSNTRTRTTTVSSQPVVLPVVRTEPEDFLPPIILLLFGVFVTFNNIIAGVPIFLVGLHFLMKVCCGYNLRQLHDNKYLNVIFAWLFLIFLFYGIKEETDNHKRSTDSESSVNITVASTNATSSWWSSLWN